MNREDIIRMAREAGFCTLLPSEHIDGTGGIYVGDDDITDSLKRFTALVAAAERERIIAANAPEIERCNAYIKELEEAMPPKILRAIRARGRA